MMAWFVLMLLLNIPPVDSFGNDHHAEVTCTNRFEFRHMKRDFHNCSDLIKNQNSVCGRNFTVAYSLHPPYVILEDGKVQGILPEMIRNALSSCCFGCNSVEFIGPYNHLDKLHVTNASLVIPIQTSTSNTKYFNHHYIHMLSVKAVDFLGRPASYSSETMAKVIFNSVINAWPLFIIAFFMAVAAGFIIWVLEYNTSSQFADKFPQGPFQGFWWAYVSMTTVGYGDKAPKTLLARLFAIVWITLGITIFTLFTASLTSSLTSAIIELQKTDLYQKKVGVLNTTTTGNIAAINENANAKAYGSIRQLQDALIAKSVEYIALDENIANFYMEHIVGHKSLVISLYKRLEMKHSSYGMLAYDNESSTFFKSFFESNDDQRDIMASLAMKAHQHDFHLEESVNQAESLFKSKETLVPTILSLIGLIVVLAAIGMAMKCYREKKNQTKGEKGHSIELHGESTIEDTDELIGLISDINCKLKNILSKRKFGNDISKSNDLHHA